MIDICILCLFFLLHYILILRMYFRWALVTAQKLHLIVWRSWRRFVLIIVQYQVNHCMSELTFVKSIWYQGSVSILIYRFSSTCIPVIKLRQSHDCLIIMMEMPMPGKMFFILKRDWLYKANWMLLCSCKGFLNFSHCQWGLLQCNKL